MTHPANCADYPYNGASLHLACHLLAEAGYHHRLAAKLAKCGLHRASAKAKHKAQSLRLQSAKMFSNLHERRLMVM